MLNLRPFQIVLIGIFVVLALGGIIFVSLFKSGPTTGSQQFGNSVVIWGTFDSTVMTNVLSEIAAQTKGFGVVRYEEKDPRTFESDLVNAIAEGNSPDLVIFPHDLLVKHRAKLLPISFTAMSERSFRDTYIDGADIFLRSDGIYGLPFAVDPLVMYWNKDLFASNGVAEPPRTWNELLSVTAPGLTKKNANLDITQSAVSFGEYSNVTHAKDILSMLFLQSGTNVVEESAGRYNITLDRGDGSGLPPADAALAFYTQFAIPSNINYTWNRGLPQDKLQFLGGDLGIYFGMGSEFPGIEAANPNLNFDIARVPQGSNATALRDYGTFYAFSIPRISQNPNGAYQAALVLTSPSVSTELASKLHMAAALRSVIAGGTADPYQQILNQSALITHGWLDPDPSASENVFKTMIEDVTSGRNRVKDAVSNASQRLSLLFKQ